MPKVVIVLWLHLLTCNRYKFVSVLVPVLKIRSHAAVWSCHVLVLRLLCSSTGVTIIMPKVLIIYRGRTKSAAQRRKKKD